MLNRIRIGHALAFVLFGIITVSVMVIAQTATGPIMRFTAMTAGVSGAPDSVRIDVLAWSTDADRDQMVAAWELTPAPAGARGGAAGARGAGGGARGARGGGGRGGDAADTGAAPANAPAAAGAAAGGAPAAGAAGGRGGRGGGRGGAPAAADVARTPEASLTAALQTARTVGYLWTSESAGYSIRYAYRLPQPDGSERIIFATERKLGAWNDLWKPTGNAAATNYEFSVIEVHLTAKGDGEGKTSLTGKVVVDSAAKTIALDGYSTLPVVLKDLKRAKTN